MTFYFEILTHTSYKILPHVYTTAWVLALYHQLSWAMKCKWCINGIWKTPLGWKTCFFKIFKKKRLKKKQLLQVRLQESKYYDFHFLNITLFWALAFNDEQKFLIMSSSSRDIKQEEKALCLTHTQERRPAEEMSRTMLCQGFL